MQIKTTRFGELEIDEEKLISFPWGMPGFETLKRYTLTQHGEGPFHWLQAVDDADVAFLVCSPDLHGAGYDIPQEKLDAIDLKNPEDLLLLNLVSFEKPDYAVRFHIRSPLLFNSATRTAFQWTLAPEEARKMVILPEPLRQSQTEPVDFIVWRAETEKKE